VTDHKIECLNCHMEIQHKVAPRVEAAATSCTTCHSDGHSPSRDLYAGIGGKGVPAMPSAMFQAGVHCEGCHFLPQDHGATKIMKANDVSCMSCHGPRYSDILPRWKKLLDERLGQVKSEWTQARQRLSNSSHEAGQLADAWLNIQLVERGVGIHNVEYSLALMNASHDMINNALGQGGLRPIAAKWWTPPFDSTCFRCHRGIEEQRGRFFGFSYPHKPHIGAGLECATCHRPHEERTAKEVVRFGPEGCANCHHRKEQSPQSCLRCHNDLLARKVRFRNKQFDHSMHVKDLDQKCADCHRIEGQIKRGPNLNTCSACHPDGWQ
jgi:hypothetical protein